ncbi:hypothetical protein HZC32_03200 [Candidatus Woesearchaeota archaeon]|nr:hypothetical protein [Candidatus Woesearchaeota archaeon]
MSVKKLLGLDSFPVREEEIMQKIQEAYSKGERELTFSAGKNRVKITLNRLSLDGLMRDYQDYYSAK